MEGNRDEADRCIEIALSAINIGNYEKATKFLRKADNLYPSQRAKDLIQHVSSMSGTTAGAKNQADSEGVRHRTTEQQRSKRNEQHAEVEKDFTTEQLEMVKRIKKCKDYYEVLGVTKEATDSEIKKAYKKLALQLHPDKNRAPGAVEAFKAVGNAVAVLTDAQKRKDYDMYGSQSDDTRTNHYNHTRFHHADHNNFEFAYARGFESEISAEELFNMFFGGFQATRPTTGGNRAQYARREQSQQPSLAFGLILVLILVSIMSSFLTSDPIYSLAQTSKYPVRRTTNHLGVPYYVQENFNTEYQGSLARLENSVEEDYITTMKQNCYRERTYRESMIGRAKTFGSRSQVAQAQQLKTPSCDNLARIGINTRFSIF